MQRCFDLALKGGRNTGRNPLVGAVLVMDNKVIGEGYHAKYGEAHAEVNCINSVKDEHKCLISKSTLYVSLEPCSYYGKTPACSQLIIQNKIPHVVISCVDPNPKVSGTGIQLLRKQNIEVEVGILKAKGEELLRKFRTNILYNRPYIALKWAQSKNGYAGVKNQPVWFTNHFAKIKAHILRSQFDGILIGPQTAIVDDPLLNVRYAIGKDPIRILIDRKERVPKTCRILSGNQDTIIVTQKPDYFLPNENVKLITIQETNWSWNYIFKELYNQNISSILIEGGPTIHKSIAKERSWDEAHVLSSNHPLDSGIKAVNVSGKLIETVPLGDNRYDHILCNHI